MGSFWEMVQHRQSCRNFSGKKPEREKLEQCLKAARLAPSACNSQPWHFTVLTDPALVQAAGVCARQAGMNGFTSQVPCFVCITEEKAKLTARIGALIKSQSYACYDIGIAAAHFCLQAEELGLSTCILGWFDEKNLHAVVGVPANKRIRLMIAVGYAKGEDPIRPKVRKPEEEIITWR